jgi:hypothetical protein
MKERPDFHRDALFTFRFWQVLSAVSLFPIAVAAVHRPVATGLERYFGRFAALGTGHREHLMTSRGRAGTCSSLCLTASGAALGLILIASGLEEFLLAGGECEGSSAICTSKSLVL